MNMIKLGSLPVKKAPPKLGWISEELRRDYVQKFGVYINQHTLMNKHIELCRNDNVKMQNSHIFAPEHYAWQLACESYSSERSILWQSCKPITLEQAIQLAQKTTVGGYIPTEVYGHATKGDFYKDTHLLNLLISKVEGGEDVPVVWKISDKTEIRINEKICAVDVSKRKQRTMMASDALHYVVGLILFHEQNEALIAQCHSRRSWSAAGVSLFHGGWDSMARYLTRKSGPKSKVRCKDVSAMESSVRVEFLDMIYGTRRHTYAMFDGTNKFQDRNYLALFDWWVAQVRHSIVLDMDGSVWLQIGQNPSGCLNTLYDNIDTNILMYRYHLARPLKYTLDDIPEFLDYCYSYPVKFMGDDSIYFDSPEFDGIDGSASQLGVVLTDESDGAVPLTQAVFCGFGFIYHATYSAWFPRPNASKLLDSLIMHRKNNSDRFEFVKLCAMKVLFFPLSDSNYQWIVDRISFMRDHKHLKMFAESQHDVVLPMHSVYAQELTESQIKRLYLRLETLQGTLQSVPVMDTINILNDLCL